MPLKEREILSRLFSSESRKSSENISKNAGKKTNFIKISREEILQSNVPTENIKPSKGIQNTLRKKLSFSKKKSYNLQDKENDVLQTGTYSHHINNVCGCSSIHLSVCKNHYWKWRLSEAQPKKRGAKAAQMLNICIQRRPKSVAYG